MKKKTRVALLIPAGAVVIAGGVAYRHYCLAALPVGEGPAGPKVDRAAFEKPWTTHKVLLLGLGDSITDGVGDASTAGLPDWPDAVKLLAAYNRIIHRCAERRESVHLVPIHAEFLGHGIHCRDSWREHYRRDDPHYWYYDNLEDPNARGYDAIRRLFLIEMVKVRNELSKSPKNST